MPAWKATTIVVAIIIFDGLIKAHTHFIRLALLAILGLLGMYLLHNLAQDWNRIRGQGGGGGGNRPRLTSVLGLAARLFRISKRSVDSQLITDDSMDDDVIRTKFSNILYFDPIGCARKFICYAASKPSSNLTENEADLLKLFESVENSEDSDSFKVFKKAALLGKSTRDVKDCEKTYRFCYLTNKQLFLFYSYL